MYTHYWFTDLWLLEFVNVYLVWSFDRSVHIRSRYQQTASLRFFITCAWKTMQIAYCYWGLDLTFSKIMGGNWAHMMKPNWMFSKTLQSKMHKIFNQYSKHAIHPTSQTIFEENWHVQYKQWYFKRAQMLILRKVLNTNDTSDNCIVSLTKFQNNLLFDQRYIMILLALPMSVKLLPIFKFCIWQTSTQPYSNLNNITDTNNLKTFLLKKFTIT